MQGIPSFTSYDQAVNYVESIKPIRGTDIKPLARTRRQWGTHQIRLSSDAPGAPMQPPADNLNPHPAVVVRHFNTDVLLLWPDRVAVSGYGSATTNELLRVLVGQHPSRAGRISTRFGRTATPYGSIFGDYQIIDRNTLTDTWAADPDTIGVGLVTRQTILSPLARAVKTGFEQWLANSLRFRPWEELLRAAQNHPDRSLWADTLAERFHAAMLAVRDGHPVEYLSLCMIAPTSACALQRVREVAQLRLAAPTVRPEHYLLQSVVDRLPLLLQP